MKIFTTKTNYIKTLVACLGMMACVIMQKPVSAQTQQVTFTTTGPDTWTVPCGVTSITVQAWGGGGAGGGSSVNSSKGGGGGAGGAYVSSTLTVTPGATYNLYVGAGATGANSAGSQGAGSWFNSASILFAEGGKGGGAPGSSPAGGIGSASASIGSTKIAGGNGGNGSSSLGGAGGTGGNGGGAGGSARTSGGAGNDGSQPGGGGGGAFVNNNNNRAGGNGGDGEIIITYAGWDYHNSNFFFTEPITNVNFAGINNSSSATAYQGNDYESYCITANVSTGSTYAIKVQGNTVGNYTDYVTVFIDWNNNGVLNDAGEVYYIGTIVNSTGVDGKTTPSYNITVPTGATLGTTKMRVMKNYNSYATQPIYYYYTYGQTEDYLVSISGNCQQPTGASITDGTNTSTTSLPVCTGTTVTLKQTGGVLGPGQTWKWYTGSCGGTLVNTNTNADASYTVTPALGTTTYFVRAEGGTCGTSGVCKSVTVTVYNTATISVATGSKDFPACKGVNNPSYVTFNIGGGGTGATITGLPAGLTYNTSGSTITISGTPSVTGSFPYTITPTGNSPCSNPFISGTVTVSVSPTSVTYTSPVTYCSGAAITPNIPTIAAGTGVPTGYSIVGTPLPNGLSLDPSTGVISGTPTTVSSLTTYTIKAQNTCGSVNATVQIAISSGDNVYNMTPTGTQNVCSSSFSGVVIGLDGSQVGVQYQLLLNGSTVVASFTGNGSLFNFSNQTAAGTYTVRTNSACKTNMNGSLTINITQQPNTSFSYPTLSYCNQGLSDAATLSGSPATGSFSALPAGLVFNDNTTGVVDLAASTPGTYSITYTVLASGGCSVWQYTVNNFKVGSAPQAFNVFGGGGYCSGGSGVEVGLDNSETGVNYQLYRNGTTLVSTVSGSGAAISFGNQTVAGTYTVIAVKSPCQVTMNGNAVVSINPNPSAITITPASATICEGSIQSLSASIDPPTTSPGQVSGSSGTINLNVPNNNTTGVSNLLRITGIPVGATITSVAIQFKINENYYDGDLVVNLKGPNGNVLNIANRIGGSGHNFNNTTVASNASTNIALGSPAYTGTYLPQAVSGAIGAQVVTSNVSNVTAFSGLYGSAFSANGNWTLSVRDAQEHDFFGIPLDGDGTFVSWSITINYTYISNPVTVTWTPVADLFTDPGASTIYAANDNQATVYAKPSTIGNKTYTATSTNSYGCSTTATTTLSVNQSPQLTVAADYCSLAAFNQVKVTATSDINISNWQWSGGLTSTDALKTSIVKPNSAGTYYVTATSSANSCTSTSSISVAEELVANGDFEAGNTGFTSDYTYVNTAYNGTATSGLYPEKTYTVDVNPQVYHPAFWGTDHTTADGNSKFMMVNGYGSVPVIWSETVTVLPNTTYYFSAYATSLNNVSPFANLSFRVNGTQIGTPTGTLPSKSSDNNPGTWLRFYGNWASGTATTATIDIIDLEPSLGGNDFGLDDISFGTLSTFLNLTSDPSTKTQNLCYNTPITNISYEVGGDGTEPNVSGLPTGLNVYWNGRDLVISGTPTQSGTFNYEVDGTGCNTKIAKGQIIVKEASFAGTFASPIISACYASNGSVGVTGTVGNILKWQSSVDSTTWTDISNTTTTQTYTNVQDSIYYRAIAQNGAGCSTDTATVKVNVHNLWTGKADVNWSTANNWSDRQLPSGPCVVVIPSATPNAPLLNIDASVTDLTIKSGASLDLNSHTLTINGTFTGSTTGTLTGSTSAGLIINGNAGTLYFTPNNFTTSKTTNNYLKALTLNNSASATIGDSLNIAAGTFVTPGMLTVGSSAVLHTDDVAGTASVLTLKSDANGDAQVGTSYGAIPGNVVVERFVPARRAWRFMGVPFKSSSQTILDAWQEGGPPNNDIYMRNNQHPGYGTEITYDNDINHGFDVNTTFNPSLKTWQQGLASWTTYAPYTNTTLITDKIGPYCLFVRGSRAVDLSLAVSAPADNTVLRIKGVLNEPGSGNNAVNFTNSAAGEYIFLSNPYASAIDLTNILSTGVGINHNNVFVWDPKLNGSYGVGDYVTYSTAGGGTWAPTSDKYTGSYVGLKKPIIQSGQAFMLQTATGSVSQSFSFNQTDKINTQTNGNVFKPGAPASSRLFVNLMMQSADSLLLINGIAAVFDDQYAASVDARDAPKLWNNFISTENIALQRGANYLAVEARPMPVLSDTEFVYLTTLAKNSQVYALKIFSDYFDPKIQAWLVDKFMNTRTRISMSGTVYPFATTGSDTSYRNRFIIVFTRGLIATPVPVTRVANQTDPGTSGNANSIAGAASGISVHPNPVKTGADVLLQFSNMKDGRYQVTVTNALGKALTEKTIDHDGGSQAYTLQTDAGWAAGVYIIKVTCASGCNYVTKLVISK